MLGRVLRAIRTPLTLIILIGLLGYAAYWGFTHVMATPPQAPPPPCVTTSVVKGKVTASQVTVNVYNGGEVRGLAGDVASKLAKKGFQVNNPSNTSQAVTTTVIVGANVNNPEVKLVLSMFKKAKARADGRSDRSVDVLVGSKYGGFNDKAKNWIAVSTSTVCLPSTAPTASASEKS